MMRYQRVSDDCFPLSNGRKPSLRACKEDDSDSNGRIHHNYSASFESKPLRARPPAASGSVTPDSTVYALYAEPVYSDHRPAPRVADDFSRAPPVTRDVLPQWGQRKRTRISRPAAEEFSGSQSRKVFKIQKRAAASAASVSEKVAASSAMPPPGAAYVRGANLRPCTPIRDATSPPVINRSVEERSGGQGRPEKRSPPSPPPAKTHKRGSSGTEAAGLIPPEPKLSSDHDGVAAEKVNPEPLEWPRIQISLSRKEKEEDFLAMKGTKLPQRPRKRPKTVERALQYVFPGMWLPDVTRSRYEVREKKCAKKKRRGLKGMDMDSESE